MTLLATLLKEQARHEVLLTLIPCRHLILARAMLQETEKLKRQEGKRQMRGWCKQPYCRPQGVLQATILLKSRPSQTHDRYKRQDRPTTQQLKQSCMMQQQSHGWPGSIPPVHQLLAHELNHAPATGASEAMCTGMSLAGLLF